MLLQAGDAALKQARWREALDAFGAALAIEECAEALVGAGTAKFWLGDLRGTMTCMEHAHASFRRRPDPLWAAICALRLAFHHHQHMANAAAASGWLARASRLVEEHALAPLRGELLLVRAQLDRDPHAGEIAAREALAIARDASDVDLELCASSLLGALLVEQGRVSEGIALLDEAMAACLGGEARNPDTVVFTSCITMTACTRCAAFERALQWVRASEAAATRLDFPFFYVECRTHHARILLETGAWDRAEQVARSALEMTGGDVPAYHALALATLATLAIARGQLEEAERLLVGFEGHPPCVPAVARIQLARGKRTLAIATLQRRLDIVGEAQLESALLVELLGEAEIADGRTQQAAARGAAPTRLAEATGCSIMRARGERLRGLGADDPIAARRLLDRALDTFVRLGMPYEVARTRWAIARALAATEPEIAIEEARTALAAFDTLQAAAADDVAAFLRERGVKSPRVGPKLRAGLSKREHEVFGLLGEGLSNPEIAARLFISRKTVEHHVASVLAKLGLRSRAVAAAEAVRTRSRDSGAK